MRTQSFSKLLYIFNSAYAIIRIASSIMVEKSSSLVHASNGVRGELLGGGSIDENVDCSFDDVGGVFIGPGSRVVSVFIETRRGSFWISIRSLSQSLPGSRVVSIFIETTRGRFWIFTKSLSQSLFAVVGERSSSIEKQYRLFRFSFRFFVEFLFRFSDGLLSLIVEFKKNSTLFAVEIDGDIFKNIPGTTGENICFVVHWTRPVKDFEIEFR